MRVFLSILSLLLISPMTAQASASFETDARPFLEKSCNDCHAGGDEAKGEIDLSTMTAANFAQRFEYWESAINRGPVIRGIWILE